jgi:uncharacterized protein YcfJ
MIKLLSISLLTTLLSANTLNEIIYVSSSKPILVVEDKITYTLECQNISKPIYEDIYEYKTVNNGSVIGGLATGGLIGAVVHNNVGGGSGKKWATGISSILGYGIGSQAFGNTQTYKRKIGEKIVNYETVEQCYNKENIEKITVKKYLLKGSSEIEGKVVSIVSDNNDSTFTYETTQRKNVTVNTDY